MTNIKNLFSYLFLILINLIAIENYCVLQAAQKYDNHILQKINFYNILPPNIEKIKKKFINHKILRSPQGTRYLLRPEDTNYPVSIYDDNGLKLKDIPINDYVAISDHNDVIITKIDVNNTICLQVINNLGKLIAKIPVKNMRQAQFTTNNDILMWGKSSDDKSILNVYNKDGSKIFEKIFDEIDLYINYAIPCQNYKALVFTRSHFITSSRL